MARKKKFAPNDNNLAIAYYRFSSHSQNDASIDQQRELAHEWADAHGFKIVQEYEDAAISGTTDARPGFQQMLSEVAKIRPHTLIMWKTDRLGRDKYVLAMAKKKIRDAGCEIHLLAEHIPTEGPEGVLIEGLMEAMAEYYSRQLSQNIQRGMDYNAQHALYNGHKLFGYDVDRSTKKYIPDPNTAPFVQWAFTEYASGRPLKAIAEEMNAQGLRTPRNAKFSVNMLNKMLKNRAYIGEYHHGDITVAGGMPVLVDEATFDRAQRRFAENKRKGSQRAHGMDDAEAPRYWLTGKLYCGECGSTMQGVSGTSATGRTYYYYYCSAQRRKECHLHKARKRDLEDMVLFALHNIVDDEENVTALALDAAEYYEKNHNDTAYLEALEAKRREVEKSLANLVKVIERGVVSDTVTQRLAQLEEQKSALNDAIGTENVRVSLCEDRHSIQAYFDKFLHADVNDPEIRDQVFEYFVDKVYLYDDKLVVSMWFSEDDKQEITWRDWFSLDEYWTDESPFVKGEAAEFDCFPFGSTIVYSKEGAPCGTPSFCLSMAQNCTKLHKTLFRPYFNQSGLGQLLPAHALGLDAQQLLQAGFGQVEHGVEALTAEGGALAGALNLDELVAAGVGQVHVDLGLGVLGIVEVEKETSPHHAHRQGHNLVDQRDARDLLGVHHGGEGVVESHPGAGHGSGARAAVGVDDVAVHGHGVFAQSFHVAHGAQAAADETLDLHGAALACGGLTTRTRGGGAGEHCVLGAHPARMGIPAPLGHALLYGGAANELRGTELHLAGARCVGHHGAREGDGADTAVGAAVAALGGCGGRGILEHNGHLSCVPFSVRAMGVRIGPDEGAGGSLYGS